MAASVRADLRICASLSILAQFFVIDLVYPPGNIVTIHILEHNIISDLLHWYVDVDQLPLERWCIYNDSVYRAFQMEKDGFGRRTHLC